MTEKLFTLTYSIVSSNDRRPSHKLGFQVHYGLRHTPKRPWLSQDQSGRPYPRTCRISVSSINLRDRLTDLHYHLASTDASSSRCRYLHSDLLSVHSFVRSSPRAGHSLGRSLVGSLDVSRPYLRLLDHDISNASIHIISVDTPRIELLALRQHIKSDGGREGSV